MYIVILLAGDDHLIELFQVEHRLIKVVQHDQPVVRDVLDRVVVQGEDLKLIKISELHDL